jgi:hypothetical protein
MITPFVINANRYHRVHSQPEALNTAAPSLARVRDKP